MLFFIIWLLGSITIVLFPFRIIRLTADLLFNLSGNQKIWFICLTTISDTRNKRWRWFWFDKAGWPILLLSILLSWIAVVLLIITTINSIYNES